MRKISIVSVWPLNKNSFAGTEKFVCKLAKSLNKKEISVDCISPSRDKNYCGFNHYELKDKNIGTVDEFFIKNLMDAIGVKKTIEIFSNALLYLIKKENKKDDFFIINSPLFCLINKKISSMLVLHDNPDELVNYFGKKNANTLLEILKNNYDSVIITPSKHYQKIYGKILNKKIKTIPHCIEPKMMEIIENFVNSKKRLNKNINKKLSFLIPSRLEPKQKGQDIAILALPDVIKNSDFNINLKLSGLDSSYTKNAEYLKKIAKKNKIKITIKKYDDIFKEMIKADIIIIPSRYESFGYSALESIALEKPVILSDIPTYKQITKGASNAYLFKSESVKDLSKVIIRVISEINKKVKPSQGWYKKYSPDCWAKKYIDLM